jgi:hypothetical protein
MQVEVSTEEAKVQRRIRRFYNLFAQRQFDKCYEMLDPQLRRETVDQTKYIRSLESFFKSFGPISVIDVADVDVRSLTNSGHDHFAYAITIWRDKQHERHLLKERWVKSGRQWFSRRAGLVVPDADSAGNR